MTTRKPEYYVGYYCDIRVPEGAFPFYQPGFLAERCRIVGVSGDNIIVEIDDRASICISLGSVKPYKLGEPEKLYSEE